MTAMKTSGYTLTFRCVNCGRVEARTHYACESVVSDDQIRARIYEANCEGCGWKGVVCGVSAIQIHSTPDSSREDEEIEQNRLLLAMAGFWLLSFFGVAVWAWHVVSG